MDNAALLAEADRFLADDVRAFEIARAENFIRRLAVALREAEAERDEAQLKLRGADRMAAAIDYDVQARLLNTRTRITDARELYGDPFTPEAAQKILGLADHPHAIAAEVVPSREAAAAAARNAVLEEVRAFVLEYAKTDSAYGLASALLAETDRLKGAAR